MSYGFFGLSYFMPSEYMTLVTPMVMPSEPRSVYNAVPYTFLPSMLRPWKNWPISFSSFQVAAIFRLVFLLQVGTGEPVLAIGPRHRVAHRRQGPVVFRSFRPGRIPFDRGVHEVGHLDIALGKEVGQLDIVPFGGRGADPLAVADQNVAQLAVRVQLVEQPVGVIRPRHEFEFHLHPALGAEVLRQFDQRIGRVPCRPA